MNCIAIGASFLHWVDFNWRIICLCWFCFKAYFISKKKWKMTSWYVLLVFMDIYIYFNIKNNATLCSLWAMFLILGYFFVPLEDVKLRQLTRRRRLHNLQLGEIFSYWTFFFKKVYFNCVLNVLLEPIC